MTPDGPVQSRHLELYGGYAVALRDDVAPLVTERMIRATTLTGTSSEIAASVAAMEEAGIDMVAIKGGDRSPGDDGDVLSRDHPRVTCSQSESPGSRSVGPDRPGSVFVILRSSLHT